MEINVPPVLRHSYATMPWSSVDPRPSIVQVRPGLQVTTGLATGGRLPAATDTVTDLVKLLLKLPVSGSILFGIRTEIVPLSRVLEDGAAASRLVEIFTTMSPQAADYKGIASARSKLIEICGGK